MVYSSDIQRSDLQSPRGPPFSMLEVLSTLLRSWRLIIVLPLVLGVIVAALSLRLSRTYEASASFMPQMLEGRPAGGTATLAQQLGVNIGGDLSGPTPQFYVDVLRSRSVLRQVAESEYEIRTKEGEIRRGTLIDLYEIEEDPDLPPPWRRAVDQLRRGLTTSVSGTGVVQLTVKAREPDLAEQTAERMLQLLNEFNMEARQSRAQEESRFIATRVEAAHADLRAAEDAVQSFLVQSPQFRNSPALLFEYERLQREMTIRQEVYSVLLRTHEQNRIDAIRDTPILTLLDHPAGTADPQPRGTIVRTILAVMLGLVFSTLIVLGRELVRRNRDADPHYHELQAVANRTWREMRSPTRWIRSVAASDR